MPNRQLMMDPNDLTNIIEAPEPRKPLWRYKKATGYVWCNLHGCIHADTLNPHELTGDGYCVKENHRSVYVRALPDEGDF